MTKHDMDNSERSADSDYSRWSSPVSSCQSSVKVSVLKKKFISPYSKKVKKTEEKQREPLLGPKSSLQSSVVSKRSELQDSSTHQMKSVQSSDRISKLAGCKSSTTNNFFLLSRSKRNRPVSAPPGQLRCPLFPSSRFNLAQKAFEASHIFRRQPEFLRVTAYKNGTINTFVKVTVPPSIRLLLEECTEKLKLNMAARRVFLADGTEALDAIDIPHDADVYISTGEPFSNPFKKIKAQ
ncbi:hypothetical protein lerEdw1_005334 [Lerista edwardsae]|nr:hypothetical protein lerEdw1_005334 [Lerista edwardsae]